jgi:SRSO17 transposase
MPPVMVPESFAVVLAAFGPCFTAPTYRTFCCLVAGWVHCVGRRTVTGVVVAAGAVEWRHVSDFHRFFGRARWDLDALGRVVFRLALAWLPGDGPLFVLVDDTLARKRGKAIGLCSMHHVSGPKMRFAP